MFPKKKLAQLVISVCQHFKVDKVVISPGSRNAPLTVGFSNLKNTDVFSIVDERCAAFFALGIAQQTQKPVALVCTSGSALLNYYPAIAEAFYSKIPLVVISADRPKHLIDIGDGQTIRQENVFQNHIAFEANLVEDDSVINNNKTLVSQAIKIALNQKMPVHINVPFDEPLYETVDVLQNFDFAEELKNESIEKESVSNYVDIWNASKKKLILVGVNFPSDELQKLITQVSKDESVLVMTETTSNLYGKTYINSIDKLISSFTEEQFKAFQPDILLTFGGFVVSKKIKQYLRKYQPKHHWHVDEFTKLDTYFALSSFVQQKPINFLRELASKAIQVKSDYAKVWSTDLTSKRNKHQEFLKSVEYSDLKVFESILATIPDHSQLQLSNSSVVRYAQLFDVNKTLQVFCNRGTSGIDGTTSTAIGAAFASKKQAVLITGDLSFFYDSNALWNNYIPNNFRIILINNSGGGIFKIIPGPKTTNALSYFETKHNLTAEHLAKMYGFDYSKASSLEDVENSLSTFYTESNQPKILEICTPSDINDVILQNYFKSL